MKIMGRDFHPNWQQVAVFDRATGEMVERKLWRGIWGAEGCYHSFPAPGPRESAR